MLETIHPLESCLHTAVVGAFELMCFTPIEVSGEDTEDSTHIIGGEVEFDGDAAGRLRLEMPRAAANAIAASFYGEAGDVSQNQIEAVVAEMTNVICGSMLSTYASDGGFCLSTPEITTGPSDRRRVRQCFSMESGPVVVSLASKGW